MLSTPQYVFLEARSRRLPSQGRAATPRPSLRILSKNIEGYLSVLLFQYIFMSGINQ